MPNAILNRRDSPLNREAVYGIMNINTITEAAIFSAGDEKRVPKKAGMVLLSSFCVMRRVRLPSSTQASSEPIKALPSPIHVDASPYFHPNCPAYPMKMTAEK